MSVARAPQVEKLLRKGDADRIFEACSFQKLVDDGHGGTTDKGAAVRFNALEALLGLSDPRAIDAAMVLLDDAHPKVRWAAVRAVRKLGAEGASDALIAGVIGWPEAPYQSARLEALEALKALDDHSLGERLATGVARGDGRVILDSTTREALMSLTADDHDAGVVETLIGILEEGDGSRERVEMMLAWLGPASVEPLIDAMERHPDVRESAAAVLGAVRDSRAIPALVECLANDPAEVRRAAVWALGEIRDARAVEALMRATSDEDYSVRAQAIEAIDEMGSVAVIAGVATVVHVLGQGGNGAGEDRQALTEATAAALPKPKPKPKPKRRGRTARKQDDLSVPAFPRQPSSD